MSKKNNKTTEDNRMQWVLLFEENSQNKEKEAYFTDYEICSEVRIPGVLEYGDGSLLCGLLSEADKDGLYSYTIRVKHIQKEYVFDREKYTKEGYFFQDGLIGELMAIFSVYFQARFFLKSTISGQLTPTSLQMKHSEPFRYIRPKRMVNHEMFTNQNRNWAYEVGLKVFLDKIRRIDQEYHQGIIQAFYWYSEAVKEAGIDHEFFYIKMVSCIEALLGFIDFPEDNLNKKMIKLLLDGKFEDTEKQEVKRWLKHRKVQHRFLAFIEKYSTGFFKGGNRKAKHCYIKKEELMDFLKRIYSARSAYLHSGKPMYISSDMSGKDFIKWDQDPSLGMGADRKSFGGNEKLPRTRWFEKLGNHCLKSFIDSLVSQKSTSPPQSH